MNITEIIQKKGYKIIEQIDNNKNFIIYILADYYNNKYILKASADNDTYSIETLKNEILSLTRLKGYNFVPKIKDYNFDIKNNFIILEKIDGYDLTKYINANLTSKVIILLNLTNAIKEINKVNIVHCDLKLTNVLIDINGNIKVLDFGIAQIDDSNKFKKYGTINYCSPEKILNQDIDFHEDMYAIGIILYKLLGGTMSTENKNAILLIKYPQKTIEDTLNFIIRKCTANNIKLRYSSIEELYRDLFELYNYIK